MKSFEMMMGSGVVGVIAFVPVKLAGADTLAAVTFLIVTALVFGLQCWRAARP